MATDLQMLERVCLELGERLDNLERPILRRLEALERRMAGMDRSALKPLPRPLARSTVRDLPPLFESTDRAALVTVDPQSFRESRWTMRDFVGYVSVRHLALFQVEDLARVELRGGCLQRVAVGDVVVILGEKAAAGGDVQWRLEESGSLLGDEREPAVEVSVTQIREI